MKKIGMIVGITIILLNGCSGAQSTLDENIKEMGQEQIQEETFDTNISETEIKKEKEYEKAEADPTNTTEENVEQTVQQEKKEEDVTVMKDEQGRIYLKFGFEYAYEFGFIFEDESFVYYFDSKKVYQINKETGELEVIMKYRDKKGMILNVWFERDTMYTLCESNVTSETDLKGKHIKIYKKEKKEKKYEEYWNLNDYQEVVGYFLECEDNMYSLYQDGMLYLNLNMGFYSLDVKEREFKTIDTTTYLYNNLVIVQDDAYYSPYKDFDIYKKNLTTGEMECILGTGTGERKKQNETIYLNLESLGEDLYVSTRVPYGILRYKDGESTRVVEFENGEDVVCMTAYQEKLFFVVSENGGYDMMEYDPNTGEVKLLVDNKLKYGWVLVANDYAYYYTEEGIKSIAVK